MAPAPPSTRHDACSAPHAASKAAITYQLALGLCARRTAPLRAIVRRCGRRSQRPARAHRRHRRPPPGPGQRTRAPGAARKTSPLNSPALLHPRALGPLGHPPLPHGATAALGSLPLTTTPVPGASAAGWAVDGWTRPQRGLGHPWSGHGCLGPLWDLRAALGDLRLGAQACLQRGALAHTLRALRLLRRLRECCARVWQSAVWAPIP